MRQFKDYRMAINYAPGARVEIRDCEWVIRRVDVTSDNGYNSLAMVSPSWFAVNKLFF